MRQVDSATIEFTAEPKITDGSANSGERMKVLAAEDNPVFQSMLRTMLTKWGYDAVITRDGNQAWEHLQSNDPPHLAILDWMMPGLDGVELCRRVRSAAREPYIYILLLTARTDASDLVQGMDAGADDYLTKPFNAHELRVRLRAGRRILELQKALVAAREELRIRATHDSLTGVLNRGCILETLQNELARCAREAQSVALLMVDLDRFKRINDTHGHVAGDAVLREAIQRIKGAIRRYDAIGRYGGEEFLVILPGCSGVAARQHAERIREAVARADFSIGEEQLHVTCSIGVAGREQPSNQCAEELIHESDVALYQAKNNGRNRVESASFSQ